MIKTAYILVTLCFVTFLSLAQKPELMIPRGHAESVDQLSLSPNGKLLASGSWDKSVRIWEVSSGRELKAIENFANWVHSVVFSPDGKMLAAGSFKELRLYSVGDDVTEIFKNQVHPQDITALAFSPNSHVLATASSFNKPGTKDEEWFEIKLWNIDGMTLLKRVEAQGKLESLRFTSNSELLEIAQGKIIHINSSDGTITDTEIFTPGMPHYLSPDGKWFAGEGFVFIDSTTSILNRLNLNYDKDMQGNHASLTIINRNTKKIVHVFEGQTSSIKEIVFTPDSHYVLSASDSTVYVYDLFTMKRVAKLTDNMSFPNGFAFTPDGKTMFFGNYDQIIRQYNFENYKKVKQLGGNANVVYNMALSPDTKSLAIVSSQVYLQDGLMQVMNFEKGVLSSSYKSTGRFSDAIQYTADNKYLVLGNFNGLQIINTATGNLEKLTNHEPGTVIEISKDGSLIASADFDKNKSELLIRSLPSGKTIINFAMPQKVRSLLLSKDGQSVYGGLSNSDKTEQIDIGKKAIKHTFYHAGQYAYVTDVVKLLISKDESTLITGDQFGNIRFWNTATGKQTDSLKVGSNVINSMIFLPGEKQLAVCNGESASADNTIKIIDIATKKVTAELNGHKNSPTSLVVTPDGKFLFSGSFDRTIRLWNLATNEMIATMVFFGEKDWVIVDKAGRFDGTEAGMHKMYYTKGLSIIPLESGFEQFYTPNLLPRILNNENFTPPIVDINTIKDAPVVKIALEEQQRNLSVEDDTPAYSSDKETVTLKVKADCPLDAVTEIRLYQNGKLVQTTRNLTVEDDKNGEKSLTKTFTVNLIAGANNFKATAFNTQRTESKADAVTINYKSLNIPGKPDYASTTLHLLIIGINAYKNPKYTLNYAKADATSFKEQMEKPNDLFSNIKVHFITDADATKINIENTFKEIIKDCKPTDVFLFYYAGHGVMSTDDKSKDFYIVPYDVLQLYGADDALAQKGISARELQEFSKNIPAQKQLFILDACQSAGALEAISMRGAAEEKAIAQLARSTGTHWLTASGSEQFATEFSQLGHGVFTYALLQGLKGDAANSQRIITINELKAYLEIQVPELTKKYKGTAQYPASYGLGNDFPVEIVK